MYLTYKNICLVNFTKLKTPLKRYIFEGPRRNKGVKKNK